MASVFRPISSAADSVLALAAAPALAHVALAAPYFSRALDAQSSSSHEGCCSGHCEEIIESCESSGTLIEETVTSEESASEMEACTGKSEETEGASDRSEEDMAGESGEVDLSGEGADDESVADEPAGEEVADDSGGEERSPHRPDLAGAAGPLSQARRRAATTPARLTSSRPPAPAS